MKPASPPQLQPVMDTSESRYLNQWIDRLLDGGMDATDPIAAALPADPMVFAERIRRRAARRVRLQPARAQAILDSRDRLILAVYACSLPKDAYSAWCDGSSLRADSNGIGALLTDTRGEILAQIAHRVPAAAPFETEIAALERVLEVALEYGARHLRVHTDCPALAQLWQKHRDDRRLAAVRRLTRRLERFELKAVPRKHNQPAHRLAQAAARDLSP